MVEQRVLVPKVEGSNPSSRAMKLNHNYLPKIGTNASLRCIHGFGAVTLIATSNTHVFLRPMDNCPSFSLSLDRFRQDYEEAI